MAIKTSKMPASWSYKGEVEQLRTDAFASLSRMLARAVAETGVNFQIHDALRSLAEQVALFRANYVRVSRGRRYKTDRSYAGSIWAKKSSGVPVASPDYAGGSVAKHRQGLAIDIHPGPIQAWLRNNGRRFGWTWTTGKRVGEVWHWEYEPALDTYKSEGVLDHAWVQRVVGAAVDGKIGTGTVGKIKAWQKDHGLEADGKVGPATKKAMKKASSGKDEAPSAPAGGADEPKPAAPPATEGGTGAPAPERTQLDPAVDGIFPWADSTTQFWDSKYPTQTYAGGKPIGLLHSTETGTWPGYDGGSSAPHLTVRFDTKAETIAARQHFSATRPSRALVNRSGGVQTNNARVFQIELIGSCDRTFATKHGYPYLPDLLTERWARDALAAVLEAVSATQSIPLASSVTWAPYPGSYGEEAAQRLTGDQWEEYTGWLGHQHAPENDHGDPGNIPVAAILAAAGGRPAAVVTPPPSTSSTGGASAGMPTGKALLMALIAAPDFPLLRTSGHLCYYGPKTGPKESVSGHQANSLNPGDVGSSGSSGLTDWQRQMVQRGYSLTIDGKYGDQCERAAKNLQKLAGITVDGLIGPDCWYAAYLLPIQ